VANAAGIDISNFQPSFDWAAEKGKSPCLHKSDRRKDVQDAEFATNWRHAKALAIVRGAYHFGHPRNGAAVDAAAFLAVVRAHSLVAGDLLALDLETTDGLPPAQVSTYARNWSADVAKATGLTLIVYTFLSFAQEGNCAGLCRYPLWIAEPSAPAGHPVVPRPWTKWAFHQYGTTRVGNNTVDVDVFNGDRAALKAFANPAPPPPPAQEEQVQSGTLINGANTVTAISHPAGQREDHRFRLRQRPARPAPRPSCGWRSGTAAGRCTVR
jgi:lysozyme